MRDVCLTNSFRCGWVGALLLNIADDAGGFQITGGLVLAIEPPQQGGGSIHKSC